MLFGKLVHTFYIAFNDGSLIMLSYVIIFDTAPTYVNVSSRGTSGYLQIISWCKILGHFIFSWAYFSVIEFYVTSCLLVVVLAKSVLSMAVHGGQPKSRHTGPFVAPL